jgi:hypothetical protein
MPMLELGIRQCMQLLLLLLSQLQAIEQFPLILQCSAITLPGVVKQLLLLHQSLMRMHSRTQSSPAG